jgi:fatty-acyl-CoA synthase
LRAASRYQATLGWNPNFAYAFMAARAQPDDLTELDLGSLRGLVNCSEPVTWESQQRFLDRFACAGLRRDVFLGCYAMAETTFALTHGASSDGQSLDFRGPAEASAFSGQIPFVSTGRPLPGVEVKVADGEGTAIPDGHLGEILVRSTFMFSGYYKVSAPELFVDGWYRTGDVGYRLDDQLFVCGRRKDMLIVGGINVFPQDLEEVASRAEGVRPGRVVSFSEFDSRVQTEKIVVLAEIDAPDMRERAIVSEIRQRILAAFQIANFEVHLVPTGWLIKSSSGKMARRANKARWLSQVEHNNRSDPPMTPQDDSKGTEPCAPS